MHDVITTKTVARTGRRSRNFQGSVLPLESILFAHEIELLLLERAGRLSWRWSLLRACRRGPFSFRGRRFRGSLGGAKARKLVRLGFDQPASSCQAAGRSVVDAAELARFATARSIKAVDRQR